MRIIAGSRRGQRLHTGRAAGFRPTSDRVREAIFSILGDELVGKRVLDLYAGSGALGFEALSRGAAEALFVEKSRTIASWIERNGRALRFEGSYAVRRRPALAFLESEPEEAARFDLVFADPPYGIGLVRPTVEGLLALPGERLLVLEREKREETVPGLPERREAARYGDTVIEFLLLGGGAGRGMKEERA